jgi:integrase
MTASKRAKNNSVSINVRQGNLRLRWTWQGRRFDKGLRLHDTPVNRTAAATIAAKIETAIALGTFTPNDLSPYLPGRAAAKVEADRPASTLALYHQYLDHLRGKGGSEHRLANHYQSLSSHLTRWGRDITTATEAEAFVKNALRPRQSPQTTNEYQQSLRAFGRWLDKQGLPNPYADLSPLKTRRDRAKRKPFSDKEVAAILRAAKRSQANQGYYEFIATLLFLGLRPSEAIGLRWKDLDWERSEISITSALGRNPDGRTSGRSRQRRYI